jgi:peptidoglycan/xylan/chitin deacetylase (PgdA/CDA1 family)
LAAQPNFEIENHGYRHRPLSVTGRSAYNIKGTGSPQEVFDEIEDNADRIETITGRRPAFFRTGTGFYDDVAIKIATELGVRIAGFTIAADAGATFSQAQILRAASNPPPGAILLFHMNHPEGQTFEGVRALYATLVNQGYSFARLSDYP